MRYLLALLFCFGLLVNSYAQTCNGSLGDPIINIDFGRGTDLYSPNRFQYVTNYRDTLGSPEDGLYTIANTTAGGHVGGWYQTGDHTQNGGGYMMIVNATKKPNRTEFYRDTITGLCPGTTYEFAAWVLNLLIDTKGTGIKPNITFTIQTGNGTASTPTGELPNNDPNWHQHAVTFTTPPGSGTAIIIMTNSAPGGGGNDIAIDDITFRACGPIVTSNFETSSQVSLYGCEGDNLSYKMKATPPVGYVDPAYQWQENISGNWVDIPGANTNSYTAIFPSAKPGTYQYRVSTAEQINIGSVLCRSSSNTLTINVNSPPPKVITGLASVCEDRPISFSAPPGETYSWTGPNGYTSAGQTVSFAAASLLNSGRYTVVVTKNFCSTTIDHDITVTPKTVAKVTGATSICLGDGVQLQASGGFAYSWSPTTGLSDPTIANPIASPTGNIKYLVTVKGANQCFDTASVQVTVIQQPTANAGKDMIIYEGQSVTLNGKADGKINYWTPTTSLSSDTAMRAIAAPTADITYTLHSTTGSPCNFEATDQVFIRVYQKVIIPNTFTPNNDGTNDTWKIKALDTYPTSDTQIFDRQGSKVFQSQGYTKAWDGTMAGKPLPAAVYYYKIDLKNGEILSGWVTIIR